MNDTISTQTRLSKWGNSLALRIPKFILSNAALSEHDCLTITPSEDGFTVRKCKIPRYDLSELVAQVTDENRHDILSWGPSRGKEEW